jgi:hypothetical protein
MPPKAAVWAPGIDRASPTVRIGSQHTAQSHGIAGVRSSRGPISFPVTGTASTVRDGNPPVAPVRLRRGYRDLQPAAEGA